MRVVFPVFVFLVSLFWGVMDSSAVANKTGSASERQILSKIKELEQEQTQYPFDADLHFILGSNYLILDNYDKSIEHYQRALLLEPDYDSAHWNLSSIYNQKGDGANAIIHMKKVEEIFLKKEDIKSLANARKRLKAYFVKYNYKAEDFESRKGLLWRLFN